MNKIDLNEQELTIMNTIVKEYEIIGDEFTQIQNSLEIMNLQKDKLLSKLDLIKLDEDKFFEELKNKYGEGKFDILTMKYYTK